AATSWKNDRARRQASHCMNIATRGLAFPRSRVTRAQLVLLEGAGEEEFTRWVKSRAHVHGWRGWRQRDSEGRRESVHTLRMDGFCEGLGVPDWEFWDEGLGQAFRAELKGASGTLGKYQKTTLPSMRRGGIVCFAWWPRDALEIEHVFQY